MNRTVSKILCILLPAAALLSAPACGTAKFLSSSADFVNVDGTAKAHILSLLDELEAETSVHVRGSDVYEINAAGAGVELNVGTHTAKLLALCKSSYERTDRLFSPALLPLSELWGFAGESFRREGEHPIPSAEEIEEVRAFCEFDDVTVEGNRVVKTYRESKLDLGGVAKGYALQLIFESLEADGVEGLVNLAGSIVVRGEKSEGVPFKIGLADARAVEENRSKNAVSFHLTDGFVSTSSDAERWFAADGVRYCHILDPRTGSPAQTDLVSATVVMPYARDRMNGALCDLYSTVLFLMGTERAIAFAGENNLSVFLQTADGHYYTNLELADVSEELLPL